MIRLETTEKGHHIYVNPFVVRMVEPLYNQPGCRVYGLTGKYPIEICEAADRVCDKIEEAIRSGGTIET